MAADNEGAKVESPAKEWANTKIVADGQEFELESAVVADETMFRRVITQNLPAYTNCELKRETDKDTGQPVVRLVKKAATKGLVARRAGVESAGPPLRLLPAPESSRVLLALIAAPSEMHEALGRAFEILDRQARGDAFTMAERIRLSPDIDRLRDEVKKARATSETLIRQLIAAPVVAALDTPEGF